MVILEGEQGIKKSQLVMALAGRWGTEISIVSKDKDTVDKMHGKWIIEVPEMTSFKKHDIDQLKAFISTCSDRVRRAYERRVKDFPRQSVFICTINPDSTGYLMDTTGNRRFLPVRVGVIDIVGILQNRDQLFAEAYIEAQKKDVKLYIDERLNEVIKAEQGAREQIDEMTDKVKEWLVYQSSDIVRGYDVYKNILNGGLDGDYPWNMQRRVGQILKKLGYENTIVWEDGCCLRVYKQKNNV
jgi:predicted P-loop ATPase